VRRKPPLDARGGVKHDPAGRPRERIQPGEFAGIAKTKKAGVVFELDLISVPAGLFAQAIEDDQVELAKLLRAGRNQNADDVSVSVRPSDRCGGMEDLMVPPATALGDDILGGQDGQGSAQRLTADLQLPAEFHFAGQ
jgi:hypothetical protein